MEWSRPGRHVVLSDSTGNPWPFTQCFLSASDENQLARFTWDGPMDCLPQSSGEKDRRASGWAELLQGKPSGVKQPAAETEGRESSPRRTRQSTRQESRTRGHWDFQSFQQVPALAGAHQLPVLHGAGRSPCCSTAASWFPFCMTLSWLCFCDVQSRERELNTPNTHKQWKSAILLQLL